MSAVGKVLKLGAAGIAILLLAGGGFYAYAGIKNDAYMARTYQAHQQEVAIPFPLSEAELSALRAERALPVDAAARPADPATPRPRRPTQACRPWTRLKASTS